MPSKVDKIKFEWFFLVSALLLRISKKSFLKIKNKNIDADKSLISVVCKGVNVELIKIIIATCNIL